MMLIDANILIYAHVSSFVQHDPARDWLDEQLNASIPLVTNPHVFERSEPIAEASAGAQNPPMEVLKARVSIIVTWS
jgi:predicted nucleic acid-binding protein